MDVAWSAPQGAHKNAKLWRLQQMANLRTLCFVEREPIPSCVFLNEGVGFFGARQERADIIE